MVEHGRPCRFGCGGVGVVAWSGGFYDAALFRLVFSSMLAMMLARNAWAWGKFGAGTPEGQGKEPSAGGYALLGSLGDCFRP